MSGTSVELMLQFLRKLDYLHLATEVSRLVCETIKDPDLPGDFLNEVELAVSEACTNAIRHVSDGDAEAKVAVCFQVYADSLIIEVKDQGEGFNIEDIPLPEFDQHPEGGYGLYIIRTVMDEVHYTKGELHNTLTMKKYFGKPVK
jgi:serine/threonine-protein kinase RsbW